MFMVSVDKQKKKEEEKEKETVESIVKRLKAKETKQGLGGAQVKGSLAELRTSIAEERDVKIQTISELKYGDSKTVSKIGSIYLSIESLVKPLFDILSGIAFNSKVNYYLNSANMKYSVLQWIAITTVVSLAVAIISLVGVLIYIVLFKTSFLLLVVPVIIFFLTAIIMFLIPKKSAIQRGNEVTRHLPFALRHFAILLKSGMGVYSAIKLLAFADYGALSEELQRVVIEIEEGSETKDALYNLSIRTQSRPLKNALTHMIRALKSGGNLSELLSEIAEDVESKLLEQIKAFTQKLNFMGVLFIFTAIVMPVLISVLGSIRNSPIQAQMLSGIPLTPTMLIIFYLLIMPLILAGFFIYIRSAQPSF